MSEHNKLPVRRAVEEVWNRGNYAVLAELAVEDIVIRASMPRSDIHGREGVKQFYSALRSAFPDVHFAVQDQIAEGDRVVTRWIARGTHTGPFQGMPPTGKQVQMGGIYIDRFADGKVVECWLTADELSMLQQLGAMLAPAAQ